MCSQLDDPTQHIDPADNDYPGLCRCGHVYDEHHECHLYPCITDTTIPEHCTLCACIDYHQEEGEQPIAH
jgi:hypothetical protein